MMEAFRHVDQEYQHKRLSFWVLILNDVARSAWSEHANPVMNPMDVPWPTVFIVGAIVGSALLFGLFRGLTAVLGPLHSAVMLLVNGSLIGFALGWAQFATVGRYFERRKLWLVASLAGGIVGFRVTTILTALASPDRTIPISVAASVVTIAAAALLVGSLSLLAIRGDRDIAVSWLWVNAIALPLAIVSLTGLLAAFHVLKAEGRDGGVLFRFLWFGVNPVVVTVAIGAMTARPLWRLNASRRSIAKT